jgi:hypothetical protein
VLQPADLPLMSAREQRLPEAATLV